MGRKIVLFIDYDFKKEPYGDKRDPFLVTTKNFRYKVELPETKKNLSLTLDEIKEKYKKKALEKVAFKQMEEFSKFF